MSDEEMYALLSQAKAQIQADEQEIDALKTALATANERAVLAERLVENMGFQGAADIHKLTAALLAEQQWRMEHAEPFLEWAQAYLDSGRWAGHDMFDAIKTELLERDAKVVTLLEQRAEHLELDADEDKAFGEKYQLRVSERDYWMSRYSELCDEALKVFVEFGHATPDKTYREQPGLLISDLRHILSSLRTKALEPDYSTEPTKTAPKRQKAAA